MARKKPETRRSRLPWRPAARYLLFLLPAAGLLVGGIAALQAVEGFLIEDRRFALRPAEEWGEVSPDIHVEGVVHARRSEVLDVFAEDAGRSLYLLPVEERRRKLLGVDWVKDATVSRVWPNQVHVRIQERTPVAFVRLAPRRGSGPGRIALIDEQGVLLEPPARTRYDLPVVTGISEEQGEQARSQRVRSMLRLVGELGELAGQVSEVDVAQPKNLKVVMAVEGRAVLLYLGRENFRPRVENFLAHCADIWRRLPTADTFDLRLDDRITAVGGVSGGN